MKAGKIYANYFYVLNLTNKIHFQFHQISRIQ